MSSYSSLDRLVELRESELRELRDSLGSVKSSRLESRTESRVSLSVSRELREASRLASRVVSRPLRVASLESWSKTLEERDDELRLVSLLRVGSLAGRVLELPELLELPERDVLGWVVLLELLLDVPLGVPLEERVPLALGWVESSESSAD